MALQADPTLDGFNSFVSVEDADSYFSGHYFGSSEKWSDFTDEDKEALLITATRTLNSLPWSGQVYAQGQSLSFPRVYQDSGEYGSGPVVVTEPPSIPSWLMWATCEMARWIWSEDDRPATDAEFSMLEAMKIGPLDYKFRETLISLPASVKGILNGVMPPVIDLEALSGKKNGKHEDLSVIDIKVFREQGPVVNGRGSPIEVTNFNMKDSAAYDVAYYPTNETSSEPLVRPLLAGEQTLSYKVYTFFRLDGTYGWIKNLRFRVTATGPQADNAQLFFKMTNVYQTPDKSFDGDMILLADKTGTVLSDPIYPMLSTVGPHMATTRQTAYNNVQPLYTPYFVTQVRVNKGSLVGNTAEFELKFECYEYYEV